VRLAINHISRYDYDQPVHYSVLRLRLRPQSSAVQVVHDWKLELDGAAPEAACTDAFANSTELVRATPETRQIVIRATGTVETMDTAGVFRAVHGCPLWVFGRITPLTAAGDAVSDLAAAIGQRGNRLDMLHGLAAEVHRRVAYEPGTTSVATAADDALRHGSGVCQDHAHILIATARALGIPARYVSGYLMMEGVAEQVATHAWAEAWVDDLGWVGFDAANAVAPDEKYVRIACGLDYYDAAPVTGMRTGAASETLAVALNVEQQ
jgi:transglutaminase-like putative cysteine protease